MEALLKHKPKDGDTDYPSLSIKYAGGGDTPAYRTVFYPF